MVSAWLYTAPRCLSSSGSWKGMYSATPAASSSGRVGAVTWKQEAGCMKDAGC